MTSAFSSSLCSFSVVFQQTFTHQVFEGFGLNHRLALVVIGTAGPDAAVTDFRFERLAFPEFQRFGRHDIVMGINQYGGCLWIYLFLGIDQGISLGWHDVGFIGSGFQQQLAPAFGTGQHVFLVLRKGTDTGNPDEAEKFFQKSVFVLLNVLSDFHNLGFEGLRFGL